jgi:hypothetical protein
MLLIDARMSMWYVVERTVLSVLSSQVSSQSLSGLITV